MMTTLARALRPAAMVALCATLLGCPPPASTTPPPPAAPAPSVDREQRAVQAEQLALGPGLTHRYVHGALTPHDRNVIADLRRKNRRAHRVDGLLFETSGTIAALGHAPADAAAYVKVDHKGRTLMPIAWHDRRTGDLVELSTGYRLRVHDAPGMGERSGPKGEKLFVYGYAYYPRWKRVLQEPVIALLEDFYTVGIAHIKKDMAKYQQVAKPSHAGGDLQLIEWDDTLLERMATWGTKLPAAPYVHLPDSGTIDIRKERFTAAVRDRRVVVDAQSIGVYREADRTRARFDEVPSKKQIEDVLLAPFRHPERYSLVDRAILLDAVYEGKGPLRLIIDPQVGGGFFVPDNGNKEVHVAYSEVDLNFRYNGLIFAKLAHEAHHVIEFRQRPFLAERCWYERDDVIETLKYLNEFMWWVRHYPGDAPNWDWAPINAGIVLASLLEGYFPNSRC